MRQPAYRSVDSRRYIDSHIDRTRKLSRKRAATSRFRVSRSGRVSSRQLVTSAHRHASRFRAASYSLRSISMPPHKKRDAQQLSTQQTSHTDASRRDRHRVLTLTLIPATRLAALSPAQYAHSPRDAERGSMPLSCTLSRHLCH
jgi:hypothetical protein